MKLIVTVIAAVLLALVALVEPTPFGEMFAGWVMGSYFGPTVAGIAGTLLVLFKLKK